MSIADVMKLRVVEVEADETVQAAIRRMLEENVGSVAVCEGSRLVGIFTERDVLRLAGQGVELAERKVREVMTTSLITVSPNDSILAVAHVMSERQIRHVPVLEGENLLGVVGIRDVLGVLAERLFTMHDAEAREEVHELLRRVPSTPDVSPVSGSTAASTRS